MSTAHRRRWFQFGLGTMFVAVAIAALLAHDVSIVLERRSFVDNFNNHDYSLRSVGVYPSDEPGPIPFIRRLLGDGPIGSLLYNPRQDQDGSQLRRVRALFPEATIWGWPTETVPLPDGFKPLPFNRQMII